VTHAKTLSTAYLQGAFLYLHLNRNVVGNLS